MSPSEFIARAVGVPWVRWRSDWSGLDCYGLVVLWHREVLGVDIGSVPQTDIAAGFSAAQAWVECAPEAGATSFMAFRRDGSPRHCGIVLSGARVLHADGGPDKLGSVRITRIRAIERAYGAMRCYRHAATSC